MIGGAAKTETASGLPLDDDICNPLGWGETESSELWSELGQSRSTRWVEFFRRFRAFIMQPGRL